VGNVFGEDGKNWIESSGNRSQIWVLMAKLPTKFQQYALTFIMQCTLLGQNGRGFANYQLLSHKFACVLSARGLTDESSMSSCPISQLTHYACEAPPPQLDDLYSLKYLPFDAQGPIQCTRSLDENLRSLMCKSWISFADQSTTHGLGQLGRENKHILTRLFFACV